MQSSLALVDYINYVIWLNGSDFMVDEIREDNIKDHQVPSQKYLGAPAHPKPATEPSTSLNSGTILPIAPVFPRAQKMV